MADAPTYVLSYLGRDYPVQLFTDELAKEAVFFLVGVEYLQDDPFAGTSGPLPAPVTITEFSDGQATGTLMLDKGFEASPSGKYVYILFGTGQITDGFDGYVPCFVEGTLLDTPQGPVPVEELATGQIVSTLSGPAPIRWIGHRRAKAARIVLFRASALGEGAPRRDLRVSADHAMLVEGHLIPAGLLCNGATIVAERRASVSLFHVELSEHAILFAEGASAESYLDTGNRAQFANCSFGYDPAEPCGEPCAEMIVAGPKLEALRAALPKPQVAETLSGLSAA